MKLRDLMTVALTFVGVWLLIGIVGYLEALVQMPQTLALAGTGVRPWIVAVGYLAGMAIHAAAGLFLLARADRLAAWLAPPDTAPILTITADEFQAIAFSLLGAYLVCDALPRISHLAVTYALTEGKNYSWVRADFVKNNRGAVVSIAVDVVVGVPLFLGSRRLVALWRRDRGGATSPPPDEPDETPEAT